MLVCCYLTIRLVPAGRAVCIALLAHTKLEGKHTAQQSVIVHSLATSLLHVAAGPDNKPLCSGSV